jgi:hypothetical protein
MNRISTVALQVRGEATRDGKSERFRGSLVLNDDWLPNATEGRRGSMTVADVRKVRGVPANLTPQEGGFLQIRIDPRFLFRGADFSALEQNPKDADGTRVLLQGKTASSTTDQVMANLYQGLRSLGGTYEFRWVAPEMSETNP